MTTTGRSTADRRNRTGLSAMNTVVVNEGELRFQKERAPLNLVERADRSWLPNRGKVTQPIAVRAEQLGPTQRAARISTWYSCSQSPCRTVNPFHVYAPPLSFCVLWRVASITDSTYLALVVPTSREELSTSRASFSHSTPSVTEKTYIAGSTYL